MSDELKIKKYNFRRKLTKENFNLFCFVRSKTKKYQNDRKEENCKKKSQ